MTSVVVGLGYRRPITTSTHARGDSRPWSCFRQRLCPTYVYSTDKFDMTNLARRHPVLIFAEPISELTMLSDPFSGYQAPSVDTKPAFGGMKPSYHTG